jgi:hypothetical protein
MNSKPDVDEIEVSIFGPGYGEGVLVHLCNNDWIQVDSCINPATKKPVTLEYLNSLGINPDFIKQIVVTHWHDDHIRGLSSVVKACPNAEIVISEAMQREEFVELVARYSGSTMMKSLSGLKEFSEILQHLINYKKVPKRAIADRPLRRRASSNNDIGYHITSLSPSDASVLISNLQLKDLIPKINQEKSRLPYITPNHASVVLWISISSINILLGSDMESGSTKETGWVAILNSNSKPTGKATVYKIPHHGSANADVDRVWDEMLIPDPIAILTPFKRGNVSLPKPSDIKRICERSNHSYITGDIKEKRAKSISTKIDKVMSKTLKNRKTTLSSFGQIRLRKKANEAVGDWKIQLFGQARLLKDFIKM